MLTNSQPKNQQILQIDIEIQNTKDYFEKIDETFKIVENSHKFYEKNLKKYLVALQ